MSLYERKVTLTPIPISSKLDTGDIIYLSVLGSFIFIAAIVVTFYFVCCRNTRRNYEMI
jgi:hypothetical protein